MKKTTILIEKLIRLANGDVLPACSLKGDWFEQMQEDGILLAALFSDSCSSSLFPQIFLNFI